MTTMSPFETRGATEADPATHVTRHLCDMEALVTYEGTAEIRAERVRLI
jgi:alkylation response protein AidB-like acyl-CoA dehydrogenase